jgi:hypothetical protein
VNPPVPATPPAAAGGHRSGGVVGALRRHPIVCLALLTPGIPEYLSSSSPLLGIVTDPAFFVLQLLINVGQYTAGALLVREALVRWRKGWPTAVLLGLAYGITEEGLGDNTLFNSMQGRDGVLGWYGRFLGVNWVWATGVLAFHVIFSIGVPIALLALALPATRGRSLVGRRGIGVAFLALGGATATETVLVAAEFHFWMGPYLLVGCLVAVAALVAAARSVPATAGAPRTPGPVGRPRVLFAVGFVLFPVVLLLESLLVGPGLPPEITVVLVLITLALFAEIVLRRIGGGANDDRKVALAAGFVVWQAVFGILLTLNLPYTLPVAAAAVYFCLRLRRAYPTPGP